MIFTVMPGSVSLAAQTSPHQVSIVGQMKDVKWKGELQGKLALDSLPGGTAVYGMGPLSFLRGEIMVYGGRYYVARVLPDSSMQVKEEAHIEAPFFGYAVIPAWKSMNLPNTVWNLSQLQTWLGTLRFYSTRHRGIFTHHDTYLHLHLLSADKQKMGHVDGLRFDPKHMRIFLPE